MDDNSNRIEYLTQIIEDLYINYKIQTLDNYMNREGKIKEITDIIYTKERIEK